MHHISHQNRSCSFSVRPKSDMTRDSLFRSSAFFALQLLFALSIPKFAVAATQSISSAFITRRPFSPLIKVSVNTGGASWRSSSLLTTRGGAISDDEYDEEEEYDEESSEFEDDDDLFELDGADFDEAEDEFSEEKLVEQVWAAWQKTPPVTKGYMTASFAATMLGYVMNQNKFPDIFLLKWTPVLKKMQIWRPFTAFLNFGSFGLAYIMTSHFVWTYMSTLERLHHNRPYDFWIMIAFGCISMLVGYGCLGMSSVFLGHNLSQYFVYVWSRYFEGMEVNMFEMFTLKAELLPWAFLAQTFLLEGQPPILDFLGIVFGHVYHHLKTTGAIRAPPFVVSWYESDSPLSTAIRNRYKTISSDFELQEMP